MDPFELNKRLAAAQLGMDKKASLDRAVNQAHGSISEAMHLGESRFLREMTDCYQIGDENGIAGAAERARAWLLEEASLRALRNERR
jgi:hypothetical protein